MKNKNSILIIDDTPSNIDILVNFLAPKYDLIVALNGKDGLDLAKSEKIDLILLDIEMPEMNGFTVCKNLKNDEELLDIPVIFLSSNTKVEDKERGFSVGAVDYITKPFNPKEVVVRVANHIQLHLTQKELISKNRELNDYRERLEEKVSEEIHKRQKQEKILIQQSKLASMGEMIDAIAHQWKQPLSAIKILGDLLIDEYSHGEISESLLRKHKSHVDEQVYHLLNTLEEFRGFMRPNKSMKKFKIVDVLTSVKTLIKDDLIKNKIELTTSGDLEVEVLGIENEFKHVILNLISNSRDAFNEKAIEKSQREIHFTLKREDEYTIMKISDTALGVPENVIEDIFKPNITTKEEGKGTGIGLYMSKQIIEKIHGEISVKNGANGAEFTIKFPVV